ncbi:hypothetical protein [Parabacteroides sp.]
MDAAAFLIESDEVNNEQWHKFSRRFFEEYRDTIIKYYGYENQMHYTPPIAVNNSRYFIAVMMVLFDSDIFGCNRKELADTLYEVFQLGRQRSTIRRWLYEMPTEYEEDLISFKGKIPTQIDKE